MRGQGLCVLRIEWLLNLPSYRGMATTKYGSVQAGMWEGNDVEECHQMKDSRRKRRNRSRKLNGIPFYWVSMSFQCNCLPLETTMRENKTEKYFFPNSESVCLFISLCTIYCSMICTTPPQLHGTIPFLSFCRVPFVIEVCSVVLFVSVYISFQIGIETWTIHLCNNCIDISVPVTVSRNHRIVSNETNCNPLTKISRSIFVVFLSSFRCLSTTFASLASPRIIKISWDCCQGVWRFDASRWFRHIQDPTLNEIDCDASGNGIQYNMILRVTSCHLVSVGWERITHIDDFAYSEWNV